MSEEKKKSLNDVDWNDPCLQRWLGSIVNKNTLYNAKSAFRLYAQYTGMTASQLIDEAIEDFKRDPRERKDIVLQRLLGFYKWLREEYSKKKTVGKGKVEVTQKGISGLSAEMRVHVIRSFYATFDITVRFKGRYKLPKSKVENPRIKFKPEDIWKVKALVEHARTPRDRAIVLFHFQGGLDVSSLCSLNYGDVREGLEKGEHPLKVELMRVKTGVEFYTFVGKDAIDALKAYLADMRSRGVVFEDKTPLFLQERGKGRLKPYNIQTMMKDLAVRAGFVSEGNNGYEFNPLGTHSLRESFGSIMINSGVPDTVVDFWLGHEIGDMARAYKTTQFEALRKMYLEREHLLSISRTEEDEKVKAEVRDVKDKVYSLLAENKKLEEKIKSLENELSKLKWIVHKYYEPAVIANDTLSEHPEFPRIRDESWEMKYRKDMREAEEDDQEFKDKLLEEHGEKWRKEALENIKQLRERKKQEQAEKEKRET